ncbi:Arc family DNA-binding protein [Providencia rettgeri]
MSKYPSQTQDKFTVRFPDGMRDAVAKRAEANGRSMNSEIIQIIQDAMDTDLDQKLKLLEGKSIYTTSNDEIELIDSVDKFKEYLDASTKEFREEMLLRFIQLTKTDDDKQKNKGTNDE